MIAMKLKESDHPSFIRWLALFWLVAGPFPLLLVLALGGSKINTRSQEAVQPARKVLAFVVVGSAKTGRAVALPAPHTSHEDPANPGKFLAKR